MGTAVEVFEGAEAVLVPRSRFAPVKKTSDLFIVRSDVYHLTEDFTLQMHPDREGNAPMVNLDPRYFQFIDDFDARFAYGVPSLLECISLSIDGDYCFGAEVKIRGDVKLKNESAAQRFIADGSILGA
jgi:UTP--glucose-1-phosphate uridylyltransferase